VPVGERPALKQERKMKNIIVMIVAVCVLAGCANGKITADLKPDAGKWQELFKADFSDSESAPGVWTVEDGLLTASKDQVIWTKRSYTNFTIDLDFKMGAAANSGVIVYCSDPANWIPNSVEIQILDDSAEKWAKADPNWKCGAVFGHLAPSTNAVKKAGEWNHYSITCKGKQIDIVLNGVQVNSMDMSKWTSGKTNPDGTAIPSWLSNPKASLPTAGRIGLQGKHGGSPIWFRNVRIKEIK